MTNQPIDYKTAMYLAQIVRLRELENAIAALRAQQEETRQKGWLGRLIKQAWLNAELRRLITEQQYVQIQMVGIRPTNNPLVCWHTSDEE